jgi:tetratricopeptide (TPR) repeat protein
LIKAITVVPDFALSHLALGAALVFTNRAAEGIAEFELALALDQNLAEAHALIGWAKYLLGRGGETEAHVNKAFRLSPRDVTAFRWMTFVGIAKSQLCADAEAVAWLRRGLEANRSYSIALFHLAAPLAHLGELDQARATVQAGLALDPSFTIRRFRNNRSSDNRIFLAQRERIYEGMRLAGVPEG